jgi:phosphate transport system substrate-binding protein
MPASARGNEMSRARSRWLCVALASALWACGGDRPPPESAGAADPLPPEAGVLRLGGSGAMGPMAHVLAAAFAHHPSNAAGLRVAIEDSIGTGGGVRAVSEGAIDLALVSRELSRSEKELGLVLFPVATDVVVIAANPSLPVDELPSHFLVALFSGGRRSLADGSPLVLLLRDPSESANLALDEAIPGMAAARPLAYGHGFRVIYHDDGMAPALFETPNAIGLSSLAVLHEAQLKLKALRIDGHAPSVLARDWPITRGLWLAARPERVARVRPFVDLALSTEGRALIAAADYRPLPLGGAR